MKIRTNTGVNTVGTLSRVYSTVLILSPILSIYGIGVATVTYVDVLLITLNALFIMDILKRKQFKICFKLMPFMLYVLISMIFRLNDNDLVFRTLRYLVYLINIIFFVPNYFYYDLGIKVYKKIAWISTIFLLLQVGFYKVLGIYIPGVIPNLYLVDSDLTTYSNIFQAAEVKRFMAFFGEPSHYAIFILGYFAIFLYCKNKEIRIKSFLFEGVFLSVGIIVSTSILGMMVMIGLWGIWIIHSFKNVIFKPQIFLSFIIIILVGYFSLSDTSAVKYITDPNVVQRQATGRFSGYEFISSDAITLENKIFGQGMTKKGMDVYLASYPILIFYFGYVGLILLISPFISYLFNYKNFKIVSLLICMLAISIGSEILVGNFIMIFFTLIISSKEQEHNNSIYSEG